MIKLLSIFYLSIILFIFYIFIYSLNNSIAMKFLESQNIIKRIISKRIYNKYFLNYKIIYKGIGLKGEKYIYHYAYVSFVTISKYFKLINATIYSVHYFSSYPIILYISGNITNEIIDLFTCYERLLVILIPAEERNVFFMKLRVALLAPARVGQIVESDTIVLPGADCLFKRIEEEITDKYSYPMMTRHTDIRSTRKGNGTFCPLNFPMRNRSMRYMHAHMSWTYKSLPYIAKIYMKSYLLKYSDDEFALNVNLWESKANKQWCTYDPLYSVVDVSYNNNIFKKSFKEITFFNFIHGCKSQSLQNLILSKLKRIKENTYKVIYSINNLNYFTNSCLINEDIKTYIREEKCII